MNKADPREYMFADNLHDLIEIAKYKLNNCEPQSMSPHALINGYANTFSDYRYVESHWGSNCLSEITYFLSLVHQRRNVLKYEILDRFKYMDPKDYGKV
jgi:hypothetical protein